MPESNDTSMQILSDAEIAIIRRLYNDAGQPPSDRKDAVLICDRPGMKCWRRKALFNGDDEFECELHLQVQPQTMLAMMCDVNERVQWDATTKRMEVLSTEGSASLRRLHEQDGDAMTLLWLVEMPWPLTNREYVLKRRVAVVTGDMISSSSGGGGTSLDVYAKVDNALTKDDALALAPRVAAKAKRVPTLLYTQAMWADAACGGTCFRGVVSEDPMMTLPKWFLTWMLDKTMPSSLKSMADSAVEYEKRQLQKQK